jgi:hypothetical protein
MRRMLFALLVIGMISGCSGDRQFLIKVEKDLWTGSSTNQPGNPDARLSVTYKIDWGN